MTHAKPFTSCANGCGIPAVWKVKRNGKTRNFCNGCATRTKDCGPKPKITTRTSIENKRKDEVLGSMRCGR